jgi:hypothetical protein
MNARANSVALTGPQSEFIQDEPAGRRVVEAGYVFSIRVYLNAWFVVTIDESAICITQVCGGETECERFSPDVVLMTDGLKVNRRSPFFRSPLREKLTFCIDIGGLPFGLARLYDEAELIMKIKVTVKMMPTSNPHEELFGIRLHLA